MRSVFTITFAWVPQVSTTTTTYIAKSAPSEMTPRVRQFIRIRMPRVVVAILALAALLQLV